MRNEELGMSAHPLNFGMRNEELGMSDHPLDFGFRISEFGFPREGCLSFVNGG